jgi:2-polyprenyl-3-methyl-5-hydroxy-6-metoxy-1,4-benzoquinol methylase
MTEQFHTLLNCPICNSKQIELFLKTKDYAITKEEFELHQCQTCQFVFTQDMPAQNSIAKYYESVDYISHSDTKQGFINKIYHIARQYMLNYKLRLIKKHIIGNRVLDVGAGTGYFLNHMKNNGYEGKGVEVDAQAREYARNHFNLSLLDPTHFLKKSESEYDLITLWHVLEHLHDLHPFMKQFKKILSAKGKLVIAVPNRHSNDAKHYGSFWAGYDVPRHLWHFTPKDVKELAKQHGFKLDKIKFLPLDPFYNSMLSEKYQLRQLGLLKAIVHGTSAYFAGLMNKKVASSPVFIFSHELS